MSDLIGLLCFRPNTHDHISYKLGIPYYWFQRLTYTAPISRFQHKINYFCYQRLFTLTLIWPSYSESITMNICAELHLRITEFPIGALMHLRICYLLDTKYALFKIWCLNMHTKWSKLSCWWLLIDCMSFVDLGLHIVRTRSELMRMRGEQLRGCCSGWRSTAAWLWVVARCWGAGCWVWCL